MRNGAGGFTLLELLLVIIILGILAAVAAPRFFGFREDAERAVVESMVGTLASARTLYIARAALCGHAYGSNRMNFVDFGVFVRFDDQPVGAPTCDGFTRMANGQLSNEAAIALHPFKQSLFPDPSDEFALTYPNGSTQTLSFSTKTGRSVTITLDRTSGNITWSATPPY